MGCGKVRDFIYTQVACNRIPLLFPFMTFFFGAEVEIVQAKVLSGWNWAELSRRPL
jgi:hypothetical protein